MASIQGNYIELSPNSQVALADDLTIVNYSNILIKIVYERVMRTVEFEAGKKRGDIWPALDVRRIEALNSDQGLKFEYFTS